MKEWATGLLLTLETGEILKPLHFWMRGFLFWGTAFSAAILLGACVSYAPSDHIVGQHRTQVVQILGHPSTELQNLDGDVMIYPRGPLGKHTYFIYLNQEAVAVRWEQVLEEKNFAKVNQGMSQDQVIRLIGISKDTFGLARGRGHVWNYRYVNPHCLWFQIEFTIEGTVRSSGYGKPPECRIQQPL